MSSDLDSCIEKGQFILSQLIFTIRAKNRNLDLPIDSDMPSPLTFFGSACALNYYGLV